MKRYHILWSIVHTFYIKKDAEIFPAHYTWKVAENGFKKAFMMNKDAMINFCKIILEKNMLSKNHWKIQVRTIIVCALYAIKYGNLRLIKVL
jgi:hypothetical protein